jgi:hypothetical protein
MKKKKFRKIKMTMFVKAYETFQLKSHYGLNISLLILMIFRSQNNLSLNCLKNTALTLLKH